MYIYKKDGCAIRVEFGKTRVILIGTSYAPTTSNPSQHSKYACIGTISGEGPTKKFPFSVTWDNGSGNSYKIEDLQACEDEVAENNPNFTFKLRRKKEE